jgi:hypothetical protein
VVAHGSAVHRKASNGVFFETQILAVPIADVNESPAIISNGAGTSAAITIAENSTQVTTVTATDPERDAATFSITGDPEAHLLAIDPHSGGLTFITPPDYKLPRDLGINLLHGLGHGQRRSPSRWQLIQVTVADVGEGPKITAIGGGDVARVPMDEEQGVVGSITTATATEAA